MNSKNLLIINIGRFFVFASWLQFDKEKGFILRDQYYSRYPGFISSNTLVKKIIKKISFVDGEVICLVDDKKSLESLEYTALLKVSKYWKKNFQYLIKELELPNTGFISIDYDRVRLINSKGYFERKDLSLNYVLRSNKFKSILKTLDMDLDLILNFINKGLPLPQQITDYYKSFMLAFAYGKILGRGLNLESDNFLIIESELFKSGFLDKSAMVNALGIVNNKIDYISFDSMSIWQVLMNDVLEEFNELKYLNKAIFYPEFTLGYDLQSNNDSSNIVISAENNEFSKEFNLINEIQGFIDLDDISQSKSISKTIYGNFLNINTKFRFSQLDIDKFKHWYRYYQIEDRKYINLIFEDQGNHELIMNEKYIEELNSGSDHFHVYYDIWGLFGRNDDFNILRIPGEMVRKGDVLIKREKFSKILTDELIASKDGVIEQIDKAKGWLIQKVNMDTQNNHKYDIQLKRKVNSKQSLISLDSERIDMAILLGNSLHGKLKKFNKANLVDSFQSILWVDNYEDMLLLVDHIFDIQPKCIIYSALPSISIKSIIGDNSRNLEVFSFVLVNGFGDSNSQYEKSIKKSLENNEGKDVIIDQNTNSMFILRQNGKFYMSQMTYPVRNYMNIYTFQDWNLEGTMIYNDEDSIIFRNNEGKVIDVADYNLIRFNE